MEAEHCRGDHKDVKNLKIKTTNCSIELNVFDAAEHCRMKKTLARTLTVRARARFPLLRARRAPYVRSGQ